MNSLNSGQPEVEILRTLGQGSSGRVELAILRAPYAGLPAGERIAVKRLDPRLVDDERARQSFEAEARAGERAQHPSLVRVLGHHTAASGPMLFMQFVPGRNLREWLDDRGPLPEPWLRRIGAEVSGALAALHAAGLVHGDVKPENVRLEEDGQAVLVDLGLSSVVDPAGGTTAIAGSPAYLAPESYEGTLSGPAADVWALGVMLYELATCRHPFLGVPQESGPLRLDAAGAGDEPPSWDADALARLRRATFRAPSTLTPTLTPFFDRLLALSLSRSPGARPSAAELSERWVSAEAGPFWRAELARAHEIDQREGTLGQDVEPHHRHLTPLVGRDEELRTLVELHVHTSPLAGPPRGALAWVTGPAGSGKTRLVRDFVERVRVRERPPVFLEARCMEAREAGGAGALLDLIRHLLGLPPDGVAGDRERAFLATFTPPEHLETLLAALGGDAPATGFLPRSIVACLAGLAAARPLLLFVDDLHQAGAATLAGLELALARLPNLAILLVLAEREEDAALRPGLEELHARAVSADAHGLRMKRVALEPLTDAELMELVEQRFAPSVPRLRLARVLWERSRGLPGLVAEILRDLRATGELVAPLDRAWVLRKPPEEIPLPGSLGQSIRRRFDRLPAHERLWLRRLSVVGGRILPEFLEQAFPEVGRVAIDTTLAVLAAERWIVPLGDRYRFARPALREAVYNSIPEARRRELHGRAADALAAGPTRSRDEEYQHIFHLRAAGRQREVVDLLLPLLGRLAESHQPVRVHSLARWGLEALDHVPVGIGSDQLRLHFLEFAADAADRLGRRGEERKHLDELASRFDDPDARPGVAARIYLLHGRYSAGVGQFGLARGLLRNSVQFAQAAGDRRVESAARRQLALVHSQVGELADAAEQSERAFELGDTPRELAAAQVAGALIHLLEDRLEEALRATDAVLDRLRPLEAHVAPDLLAGAHLVRARIWRTAGRPGRAIGSANHALRLAERAGLRRLAVEIRARLGGLWVDIGRTAAAQDVLRDALDEAHAIEDRRGEALASLWLGTLLYEQEAPGARAALQRAASLANEIGYGRAEAVVLAILARYDLSERDTRSALERSERALGLLESLGAELGDRVVIAGTRAMILRATQSSRGASAIERRLRARLAAQMRRITDRQLRRACRAALDRLLAGVLSSEDVIYPRSAAPRADH